MENKKKQSKENNSVSVLQPNRRLRKVAGTRNDDPKGIVECPEIGHDCC